MLKLHDKDFKVTERFLILPSPCISEICIKIKINLIFISKFLCSASKGFMKAFEATQKSVKMKIQVIFLSSSGNGKGRAKEVI